MIRLIRNLAVVSAFVAASVLLSAGAHASIVIVNGTDDIFAAGLASVPSSAGGGGTLPSSIAVTPGEVLQIDASGTVFCCVGSPGGTGPNGFATNPFGTGSVIMNSTGSSVGTYTDPAGAFALAGFFLGATDNNPFKIGETATITVPTGATALFFGLPDANGFNGPSGFYADNSGSFTVNVSAVPESASWAMMVIGFLGVGLVTYRRKAAARLRII